MNSSLAPKICSYALAAMCTAGISHWWSVREFTASWQANLPTTLTSPSAPMAMPEPKPSVKAPQIVSVQPAPKAQIADSAPQKEFFEAMLKEIKTLRTENLNLVDQMAETNRELMRLEFRVDTHSESFRPLPVSEDRPDTSFDDGPGVLPPRAEPVFEFSDQ